MEITEKDVNFLVAFSAVQPHGLNALVQQEQPQQLHTCSYSTGHSHLCAAVWPARADGYSSACHLLLLLVVFLSLESPGSYQHLREKQKTW